MRSLRKWVRYRQLNNRANVVSCPIVGSKPGQHLEMVDQRCTNVGHKQRRCVLYSDGRPTIIGPTYCVLHIVVGRGP